jgi:hypothetical protein
MAFPCARISGALTEICACTRCPASHAAGFLAEYVERARLAAEALLNGERLHRINSWQMVRRRASGIATEVC